MPIYGVMGSTHGRRLGARVWGRRKKFFADQIFEWPFLGNNFHFNAKIFLVFDSLLSVFYQSLLSEISYNYTVYDPFSWRKTFHNKTFLHLTFSRHFILSRASHNTTSPNIGGLQTPTILGGPFPESPLSLRHGSTPNESVSVLKVKMRKITPRINVLQPQTLRHFYRLRMVSTYG